ncbi:MAG: hypothetical protein D6706_12145 [Chloroflexi bacterium]|nr:MAG: hypothetical protein D6706_12145 [Chloroflexota bacterium]
MIGAGNEQLFEQLTGYLQQVHNRRRWQEVLIWLPRGLLAGLLTGIVLATVARFRPFLTNEEVAYAAGILAGLGVFVATVALWWMWRQYDLVAQARFADRWFRLQERVTTAVEIRLGRLDANPVIAQQQLADTITAVSHTDPRRDYPLHINRQDWIMILLTLALLITAVLLPNPQEQILKKQRAINQTIEEQKQELQALVEEINQNPNLTQQQKEEILQPVENALEQLNQPGLSQEEAVATLSEAEAELRELGEQYSNENLRQQLQQAGEPLSNSNTQNAQSLGNALQNGNLSQAGQAAAQLADQLPELTPQETQELAQELAETAEALRETDSELAEQFAEAAQALQNGDTAAAQQALREAAGTLQERAQELAAAQQAQAAAGQLNQGRQAVAQAGQTPNGNGQQGQNQPGQGQGQTGEGQGQGQGEGQGQGQIGEGQGQGQEAGAGQGAAPNGGNSLGSEQGGSTGSPAPGGGHTENVYVPPLIDLSEQSGVEIELPAECVANPANCGQLLNETPTEFTNEGSVVPYNQVFGDYRDAAYEALDDEYIPLALKGLVRDYFSSLEP